MDLSRRELLAQSSKFLILSGAARVFVEQLHGEPSPDADKYKMAEHWWGMTIDISKCIGCGNCVRACAAENGVPKGFYRTWVERYHVNGADLEHPEVDSPDGAINGFPILNRPPGTRPRVFTVNAPVGQPVAQQCGKGVHIDAHINVGGVGNDVACDSPGTCYPYTCTQPLKQDEAMFAFFFFDL